VTSATARLVARGYAPFVVNEWTFHMRTLSIAPINLASIARFPALPWSGTPLSRLIAYLVARRTRACDARELRCFSDRELRDLRLTRIDVWAITNGAHRPD